LATHANDRHLRHARRAGGGLSCRSGRGDVGASGRIKTIVDTKFDKNDPDIFKNKFFVEKVDETWNLVKEEAIKAQGKRS
jgi:hypothetical protein